MDATPSTLSRTPPAPSLSRSPRAHDVSPPPNLAIKKRKPRSSSVIFAANQRVPTASKSASVAVPSHHSASAPLPPSPSFRPQHSAFRHHPPTTSSLLTCAPPNSFNSNKLAQRSTRYSDVKRKGLRHFAIRVSRKVEQQRITTYNQVADELVAEERALRASQSPHNPTTPPSQHALVDEKNIRRRVYDSLNVLMAMGIIAKDKKLISWQGLDRLHCAPHSHQIAAINNAIAEKKAALAHKQALLADLKDQHSRTCAIIDRNRASNYSHIDHEDGASCSLSHAPLPVHQQYADRIGIPFFILSAPKDTTIELEMDQSSQDICFTFNSSFAIFDDREVIRRMLPSSPTNLPTQPIHVDPVGRITLSP
ncbi:Transcription factor-like protein DPB [Gracilariopsis chorda]|uniref:Transcription factor-like protein DPB n=1 Tax=Gracilariopsis chorda TaxID=448386 RepID=A0A2V3J180_9FLOR|nr:Transcription factor-like protein DPB [Gracilariopsis chorda]|eukprot:PXF48172.1 Transcription factor-like protein DPB [Gracilariopsis chorda]